jgi:hypothetical protein
LLTLDAELSGPLEVSIRAGGATIPAQAAFFTEADAPRRSWTVNYSADINAGTSKVLLGTIRREAGDLTFAWSEPAADAALRRQLLNCHLELRKDKTSRLIQLREPVANGPLVLDLSKDTQSLSLPITDPPKQELLRFEIQDLIDFPGGAKLRGSSSAALGKTLMIEFADLPGAQIEIRFHRPSANSGLALRLEPTFRENATKEFELTLARLEAFRSGIERSLSRARQDLPVLVNEVSALQRKLKSLLDNAPAANDLQVRFPWEQQVSQLNSNIKRGASKVATLQRQIPEFEARLAAVPKMRTFLEGVHQKASIRYLVCAECGDHDLVLVDGTRTGGSQ